MRCKLVWTLRAETLGKVPEPSQQFFLVRSCDCASWMIQVRKLCGDIELRAPAIVWPADVFSDPFELGFEFAFGVGGMALGGVVPTLPEVFVFSMKKRGNQIILGSKMAVKAGFGNARFFHDKVYTHSTHAATVEEGGGCF